MVEGPSDVPDMSKLAGADSSRKASGRGNYGGVTVKTDYFIRFMGDLNVVLDALRTCVSIFVPPI